MTKKTKKRNQTLKIPKLILITGSFLSLISTKLLVSFAARLFTTPIKHKMPKREIAMDQKSTQGFFLVPSIEKKIRVYHYGNGPKKILLVHGWSGRGTQLVTFAEGLEKLGYSTISFDGPAHGKSSGSRTLLPEFIASILALEKEYGPFDGAIGHSLGGMALLNAVHGGLDIPRLVTIGSADIIQDIMDDFIKKLELKPEISDLLCTHFEKNSFRTMNSYSSSQVSKTIEIPVLVVHDENDLEVPVHCAKNICEQLDNGLLFLTKNLGHRKILGDAKVVEKTLNFITQ